MFKLLMFDNMKINVIFVNSNYIEYFRIEKI